MEHPANDAFQLTDQVLGTHKDQRAVRHASIRTLVEPTVRGSKSASVIRYGFYRTKAGKRRRYRCSKCRKTFCSTVNTAYYRLQHRRSTFDEVAALSVEGVSKSAIARVKRLGWNTVGASAIQCGRLDRKSFDR